MTLSREPRLHTIPIPALRPTQITVGMREVEAKRKAWRGHPDWKKGDFLGRHTIPVVWGPKERYYIIDHHHLCLALHKEGVKHIATAVISDLRVLSIDAFWIYLDNRGWMHPFNADGERCAYVDLPKSVSALADDPYRSLAGQLRRQGGFAKDTTPFSEFLWADFLRRRIKHKDVVRDFAKAAATAMKLAKSSEASYLPGWCGPVAHD